MDNKRIRIATKLCVALIIGAFIATPSQAQVARWLGNAFRAALPGMGKIAVGVTTNVASALLVNALTSKVDAQPPRGPKSTILNRVNAPLPQSPFAERQARPKFAAFFIDFVINEPVVNAETGLVQYAAWKHQGVLLFSGNQGYMRIAVSENDETVDQVVDQDALVSLSPDGTLRVRGSNPRAIAGELHYEADSFYLSEQSGGDYMGEAVISGGGKATIRARFLGVGALPDVT